MNTGKRNGSSAAYVKVFPAGGLLEFHATYTFTFTQAHYLQVQVQVQVLVRVRAYK